MELAQYFRDKIERRARFYGTQAKLIDAPYLVQVERLAERSDDVYARFYRETMAPRYILSATAHIRSLLESGKIVEADRKLGRLENAIQYVDRLLTQPYFYAGFKVVEGGRKAAA